MSQNFIHQIAHKARDRHNNLALGIWLAFTAGAMNAGGFLAVGSYTSHMTGITSSIGDLLGLGNGYMAILAVGYIFSFLCGAALCSIMVITARAKKLKGEIAYPLLIEAALLIVFAVISSPTPVVIGILCFMMGLQNAIITKASHAEIRTTHVTGLVTDIGIEIGRYIYQSGGNQDKIITHPEKLRLHVLLLASFIAGSIAGAFSFLAIGNMAALFFAAALVMLTAQHVASDIKDLFFTP